MKLQSFHFTPNRSHHTQNVGSLTNEINIHCVMFLSQRQMSSIKLLLETEGFFFHFSFLSPHCANLCTELPAGHSWDIAVYQSSAWLLIMPNLFGGQQGIHQRKDWLNSFSGYTNDAHHESGNKGGSDETKEQENAEVHGCKGEEKHDNEVLWEVKGQKEPTSWG